MRLTKASDYALVLLAHLAALSPGERASVRQIATCYGVPQRFLAVIVHRLAKTGLLHSMKGSNGGIRLARRSSEITLREVIEAVEGPIRMTDCQGPGCLCERGDHCTARHFWDVANEKILNSLNATTLEEIAGWVPWPQEEVATGERTEP
ncbi:MAG: Rrf2 family transcriptional regulator [Candidatus Tectomicrobia bacterium]|uniref:Rrf2 family transcriptional regulator n=1 Tax=Tectimicrobiota bacterium TaxID=2528274 RepID=A0A932FW94_UNCTE|nr:Rrf2 family transcriptional regulator [Candidatus Tectomicrobia bacterium]